MQPSTLASVRLLTLPGFYGILVLSRNVSTVGFTPRPLTPCPIDSPGYRRYNVYEGPGAFLHTASHLCLTTREYPPRGGISPKLVPVQVTKCVDVDTIAPKPTKGEIC